MWIRGIIGGVLAVVGVVWIFQGIGTLHGSFMTGEAQWAVIGVIALALGAVQLRVALRSRRP